MLKILALALALRLLMLGSVPPSLNWDEVSMGYTAYSVSETGSDEWGSHLPLFFRSYGEWKSAVYIYLLVPLIKLFGLSPFVVRLPSALLGVVSVYLIYQIAKRLYSHQVGLWAAFLMAVTPWSFFLSRPAFEANVALTLILAGIHFFLRYNLESKIYLLIASGVFFGLAPHTYNSPKLVVPLLVIYLVWSTKLYKNLKSILLYLAILALFAFPILTNLVSGYSQARYNQVSILTDGKALDAFYHLRQTMPLPDPLDKLIINKGTFFAYQFVANFLSYFSPGFLVWQGGTHTQQSLPYHGVLYVSELVFVVLGVITLVRHKRSFLPFALIVLGLVPAAITRDPQHVLRASLAIPGFILLAGLGWEYLTLRQFRYLKIVNWLLIIEISLYILGYFFWYAPAYARDWQYGYPQVSAYLEEHGDEYDSIVVTKWYGEPQLFLAFYGQWDPVAYQSDNRPNLRYQENGKMWLDQLDEYHLGKYTFKYLNWQEEERSSKTLYVGKADDFYPDSNLKTTIYYPDGSVAFHIVQGDK